MQKAAPDSRAVRVEALHHLWRPYSDLYSVHFGPIHGLPHISWTLPLQCGKMQTEK